MPPTNKNTLFYGDNLEVLRKYIKDETVDLCYIDPPFNSKRTYNQIYNNIGGEDRAQAQAFMDTWEWDEHAISGYSEILGNDAGRFTRETVELTKGLHSVLGKGSLLAYLVTMTLRITEIQRVLKRTGSLYLHCDPTASHYLKLVLDGIFVPQGGDFLNEIIWNYMTGGASKRFYAKKHDILFYYSKTKDYRFYPERIREPRSEKAMQRAQNPKGARISADNTTKLPTDVWQIPALNPMAIERLGYPTQKPEALLERVIQASSDPGDVVLDAFCGCGTTITVAQGLNRQWIGIDITYQSIAVILERLEATYGKEALEQTILNGIPQDIASARALALKKDDRVRKEFEKWAVLTYSSNRAIINDRKGGDKGIDGTGFFLTDKDANAKIVFQVKSGNVGRGDISKFNNDRAREEAELGIFLTLQPPTQGMKEEANATGFYEHKLMNRNYPRIQIVTIAEIIEQDKRLDIPMSLEVLKRAQAASESLQTGLFQDEQHP
jgi:site-specific DNA-methyltransferase (adenine-specific)